MIKQILNFFNFNKNKYSFYFNDKFPKELFDDNFLSKVEKNLMFGNVGNECSSLKAFSHIVVQAKVKSKKVVLKIIILNTTNGKLLKIFQKAFNKFIKPYPILSSSQTFIKHINLNL